MNQSKMNEENSEMGEMHLQDIEHDLRLKIAEAKTLAKSMKTSLDNDNQSFQTTTSGVS